MWLQGGHREHRPIPETPDGGGADLKGAWRDLGEEDKLCHPSGHPCPPLPRVPRTAPRVGHRARVRGHEGSAGLLPCLGTSRANPSLPRELLLEGRRLTRCLALPARLTQWTDLLHRAPRGQAHARSLHADKDQAEAKFVAIRPRARGLRWCREALQPPSYLSLPSLLPRRLVIRCLLWGWQSNQCSLSRVTEPRLAAGCPAVTCSLSSLMHPSVTGPREPGGKQPGPPPAALPDSEDGTRGRDTGRSCPSPVPWDVASPRLSG